MQGVLFGAFLVFVNDFSLEVTLQKHATWADIQLEQLYFIFQVSVFSPAKGLSHIECFQASLNEGWVFRLPCLV